MSRISNMCCSRFYYSRIAECTVSLCVTMTLRVCVTYRRIADNPLQCDCRLSWLSKWLRLHPTLGLFTRCASPHSLRGRELVELQQSSFVCSDGKTLWTLCAPWLCGFFGCRRTSPMNLERSSCSPNLKLIVEKIAPFAISVMLAFLLLYVSKYICGRFSLNNFKGWYTANPVWGEVVCLHAGPTAVPTMRPCAGAKRYGSWTTTRWEPPTNTGVGHCSSQTFIPAYEYVNVKISLNPIPIALTLTLILTLILNWCHEPVFHV